MGGSAVSFTIALELDISERVTGEMNDKIQTALIRAINKAADRGRTMAAKAVKDQVAFPAHYLQPAAKKLWVRTRATKAGPFEAIIQGRDRPTSLARFSKQKPLPPGSRHRGGVRVTVKPGQTRTIRRAFLITLKNNNIGLAVRTDGEAPPGAYKPKEISPNLWLLYGPSVDQALSAASDDDGVYEDITPELLDILNAEFNRQMDLLDA